uniref:Uncharacterized protein n=1 Tax=Myotis myotis TaxID=51298 RepID=A0A7J7XHS2_MYOMY|nr:hypothetical protein mMyoMyo1_011728 [Myotis myotis]
MAWETVHVPLNKLRFKPLTMMQKQVLCLSPCHVTEPSTGPREKPDRPPAVARGGLRGGVCECTVQSPAWRPPRKASLSWFPSGDSDSGPCSCVHSPAELLTRFPVQPDTSAPLAVEEASRTGAGGGGGGPALSFRTYWWFLRCMPNVWSFFFSPSSAL